MTISQMYSFSGSLFLQEIEAREKSYLKWLSKRFFFLNEADC